MATPATVSSWLDELAISVLAPTSVPKQKQKGLIDGFRRRVRRHNYGRTNQFEVIERLDGLEEKFQILTLDSLSDALRHRRLELKEFEHPWLPDVLDFLLKSSGNPARNERLLELYRVPPRIGTPPPLRWKDILADSPIDCKDRLWRVPDFRDADDSGHEDETPISSMQSSPYSRIEIPKQVSDYKKSLKGVFLDIRHDIVLDAQTQSSDYNIRYDCVTEEILVRESLFLVRGLPSVLFTMTDGHLRLVAEVRVDGLPRMSVDAVTDRITSIRYRLNHLLAWLEADADCDYIQAMKTAAETVVRDFYLAVDAIQQKYVTPQGMLAVSVIDVTESIETSSTAVSTVARFLEDCGEMESICYLETLFEAVQLSHCCGDMDKYKTLSTLLVAALHIYQRPILHWLMYGQISFKNRSFFIETLSEDVELNRLWHNQFVLQASGPHRPASFMRSIMHQVLACGKTSAFLRALDLNHISEEPFGTDPTTALATLCSDVDLPLTSALENLWQEYVTQLLMSRTETLKAILRTTCDLRQTLDALGQIYLHGILLEDQEAKLFDRIDGCIDSWNDRFQLRDMLKGALSSQGCPELADLITVGSIFTSSSSMQSRRTSVKILSALSFEYHLPWPLANIIGPESMTAYRQVALVLFQIRRAKYCLERIGYIAARDTPLQEGVDGGQQKTAQMQAFALLNFVKSLYDHLTTTTIRPTTKSMHHKLGLASTVDEMIDAHTICVTRLEHSCLAAPKLKILRQSLTNILDLCLRFSYLVSNPAKAKHMDSDNEAGSFLSARSRKRHASGNRHESDADDNDEFDQMGEGYSSFIILDTDTSIPRELEKLRITFQRKLKFFIAGLRGVGKAGEHVQDLELLADRLEWCQIR